MTTFSKDQDKGQFTIEQKKKKREIFEEQNRRVDVPPDVGEQTKEALQQTGEDNTQGW